MFDELIRQFKRSRSKTTLSLEARRRAKKKTDQARVSPQHVQVVEEFGYRRSTGKWEPVDGFESGQGTISAVTSIDDNASLATPGRIDVRALQLAERGRPHIYGSFLSFHNHGMTDLEQLIAEDGGFDAIRLVAPTEVGRPAGLPPESGLRNGHAVARYTVEQPPRQPMDAELVVAEGHPREDGLEHNLYLMIDIKLYLPKTGDRPQPHVETIELDWSWLDDAEESVDVQRFNRIDYENPRGFWNIKPHSLQPLDTAYDTVKQAIVCRPKSDTAAHFVPYDPAGGREETYYYSVLVEPKRPLQLIDDYSLTCRISVAFDSLLSGTRLRVVEATGYPDQITPIKRSTKLSATVELDLEHAMANRLSEHQNRLRFPGVQPTIGVIENIRTTLRSCGYRIDDEDPVRGRKNEFDVTVLAHRLVQGERVNIRMLVEGHQRRVDRTLRGSGGPKLQEELEAGDVTIRFYGDIEGDHRILASEMNNLHDNFRSRLATFVEL